MRSIRRIAAMGSAAAAAVLILSPSMAAAEGADEAVERLRDYSLEDLANLAVTTVARRAQAIGEAPAAVYVITGRDIARAGATSLPEALRLAPNVEVAQINAYSYAVSVRGFNSFEASNKLLVQIDGRSIYSPAHSGVFWQNQDVMLADLDRIEVVGGPGGTLWGANAVNGVINVISKPATETLGPLVDVGGGDQERFANLRYGFELGEGSALRVFGGRFEHDDTVAENPAGARDAFRGTYGGFRADHETGRDSFTLQGDAYRNTAKTGEKLAGNDLIGRWRRTFSDTSALNAHIYYERFYRGQAPVYTETLHTWDLAAQHTFAAGSHNVVWGGEFRSWHDDFQLNFFLNFHDPVKRLSVTNLFVQDEVELTPDLRLTLGVKGEYSSYAGMDFLPSARLAWQPSPDTLLWGAVSRTVRTPNRIERELEAPGILAPSPDYRSEEAISYEAGYRGRPANRLTLSVNAFYNRYDKVRSNEHAPAGLPVFIGNGLKGETWGGSAWGIFEITPNWRLRGGASVLRKDFHAKPGSVDVVRQALGYDPKYEAQIRSVANLTPKVTFDVALRTVGRADDPQTGLKRVGAYTEADARLAWRIRPDVELSVAGFNLLHDHHVEYNNPGTYPVQSIPRSAYVGLRWGF